MNWLPGLQAGARHRAVGKSLFPVLFVAFAVLLVLGSVAGASDIKKGELAGLPAGQCQADGVGWFGAAHASQAPNVSAAAASGDFTYGNAAVWHGGGDSFVCGDFASPEHRMADVALSFSMSIDRAEAERFQQSLQLDQPGSGAFSLQQRSDLWGPESADAQAGIDGLLRVLVSPDDGRSWQNLYTFDAAQLSNASAGGYVSIALPAAFVRTLDTVEVKVEGLRAGDTEWAAYIDSVFISYEVAPGQQLSVQALGVAGEPNTPVFGSSQPAGFRFETSTDSSGMARDTAGRLATAFRHKQPDVDVTVKIVGPDGQELGNISSDVQWAKSRFSTNDAWEVTLTQPADITPGKHTATFEFTDAEGNVLSTEQDFMWGVLAINTHKSIYQGGDTVRFDMAVLDEVGMMVCDADVTLEIDGPYSATLSTADGTIIINDDCHVLAVTGDPDYEASWEVPKSFFNRQIGDYQLTLTATTANGTYSISDSFKVGGPESALIERRAHTRIMPAHPYQVFFEVTPQEDFTGVITETVPSSFKLSGYGDVYQLPANGTSSLVPAEATITPDANGKQQLRWHVSLEKDTTYQFSYYYDAPLISPEFYLLGPLTLESESWSFAEPRQWQIASDQTETWYAANPNTSGLSSTCGGHNKDLTQTAPSLAFTTTTGTTEQYCWYTPTMNQDIPDDDWQVFANAWKASNGQSVTFTVSIDVTDAGGAVQSTIFSEQRVFDTNNDSTNVEEYTISTPGSISLSNERLRLRISKDSGNRDLGIRWGVATSTRMVVPTPPTVTVGTAGSHIASTEVPSSNVYVGGAFTFQSDSTTVDVTEITVRNTGTVDAENDLSDVTLYYKQEATCSSSIPGDATQFNTTPGNFDASGDVTVTGTMSVDTSQVCVYAELDVEATAGDGDTIKLQITDPSSDVAVSEGEVEPGTPVAISDSVTLETIKPDAPVFRHSDDTNQVAFNNVRQHSTTPLFRASATHFEDFDRFRLELNTAPNFSGDSYTEEFSGTFTSGTAYNLQTTGALNLPDTDGVTYYVRAQASADGGASWGDWSSTTWTYTYKSADEPPDWHQTTDAQFEAGTLDDVVTSGAGSVQLDEGAGESETPTHVQSDAFWDDQSLTDTVSQSFPSANTAGNTIIVATTWRSSGTVSCSDSQGNSYTVVRTVSQINSPNQRLAICYANNINGGSNTVTATFFDDSGGFFSHKGITIGEYSGIATSNPVDVHAGQAGVSGNTNTDDITSSSATTTGPDRLVFGSVIAVDGTTSITQGTGFTMRADDGSRIASEDMLLEDAGSTAATFTFGTARTYNAIMAAFKPESAGAEIGTITSPAINISAVPEADGWDAIDWSADETNGSISLQVRYTNSSRCDTLVPFTVLPNNPGGYTSGPIDISGLDTNTYHELCLVATLEDDGGTPFLEDWTVTWDVDDDDNTAPDSPANLAQTRTNDTTIAADSWINESEVKFSATVSDDDGDQVQLCVEVKPLGTAFDDTEDDCGSLVASNNTATVTIDVHAGINGDDEYHWQARAKDDSGESNEYSDWVSFGAGSDKDFGIDITPPTGGNVYDGDVEGVDATFNDGSLSELSANWDGFDFGVSGPHLTDRYEYSIGTTQGGTDVHGWTGVGTSTDVTATGLDLQTSEIYYFNVRAHDDAGNDSVVSSDGQFVLPTLSFSIAPGSVTFNNLNEANDFTDDTQQTTLTTSTNAYGGYVVRAWALDMLSTPGGFSDIGWFDGGSYASPATWGSEHTGFGYTSSDTDIQGEDKFAGGTLYAPFTTSEPGDIVADHTNNVTGTPVTDEQFTISYRVTTSAGQPSGVYSTVIMYTVTAEY